MPDYEAGPADGIYPPPGHYFDREVGAWWPDRPGAVSVPPSNDARTPEWRETMGNISTSRQDAKAVSAPPQPPQSPERIDAVLTALETLQKMGNYLHDAEGIALDKEQFIAVVIAVLDAVSLPLSAEQREPK